MTTDAAPHASASGGVRMHWICPHASPELLVSAFHVVLLCSSFVLRV